MNRHSCVRISVLCIWNFVERKDNITSCHTECILKGHMFSYSSWCIHSLRIPMPGFPWAKFEFAWKYSRLADFRTLSWPSVCKWNWFLAHDLNAMIYKLIRTCAQEAGSVGKVFTTEAEDLWGPLEPASKPEHSSTDAAEAGTGGGVSWGSLLSLSSQICELHVQRATLSQK